MDTPRKPKDPEKLRTGFTTGTCAAAAAKAAAQMLLTCREVLEVSVKTPKGPVMRAEVLDVSRGEAFVKCAVRKDAGDDPDVTNGTLVYAEVRRSDLPGIVIDGGEGIGRVTRPGLDQPVGCAAINSTPRRMIAEAVREVLEEHGGPAGMNVIISIPAGTELAKKTFNPKLGIVGGISVLGTSGIVKPMSEEALVATIRTELRVRAAEGYDAVLAAPGNYGMDFLKNEYHVPDDLVVSSSNFLCDTVQMAARMGFRRILFAGHIGKMIKAAGGIRNTHSRYGDHRMEIVSALAEEVLEEKDTGAVKSADETLRKRLMDCVMMDAATEVLEEYGLAEETYSKAARRVKKYIETWAAETGEQMEAETILFGGSGILAKTEGAEELIWYILSERDRVRPISSP